ncbi:MAG: CoA-binding protein [Chloroflexi bacterium]|uniref:CoA-binding protein n=1 Tax=Candidatus Chlorohelix allophototropha TaxID=3003348 RepID=A0A8T7M948_9CHLR|nr:CoA-binding protein [Chloroflexota bacterium]WJW68405.1 CoA-binding protein [Chloroflexota bacterium L227-S17]
MSTTDLTIDEIVQEAVDNKVWALVGASTNPDKYGNVILHNMANAGYTIYPINPRATEIDGIKCYPNLSALPEKPTVVDFVLPAKLSLPFLEEAARLGIKTVWFQPGAESRENIARAKELGLQIIYNACCMVAKGRRHWR